jgi:hypothetical protein
MVAMRVKCKVAARGSQMWLQRLINKVSHLLDSALARELSLSTTDKISWLSPRADDDHAEYRDDAFLKRLGLELERSPLSAFWPQQGPQWDALGRTIRSTTSRAAR